MAQAEADQPATECVEDDPPQSSEAPVQTLSKNQQKKLRRHEMKMKHRMEKRVFERERKKEKRKLAKENGVELPPSRKQLRKVVREPVNITVVVDSSFEEYMSDGDLKKLVKQIQHCYAINRRSDHPFQYCVSSYDGKVKEIIDNLEGTRSWDVNWSTKPYNESFAPENIVYLAAESDNVLTTLEEGKVYVIGGLVDHNSRKGLCYKLAREKGISHAQLPISDYIDMKCRKVLTIDHVFDILSKYYQLRDWEAAFFSVIPKRKGALSKSQPSTTSEDPQQGEGQHALSGEVEGDATDQS